MPQQVRGVVARGKGQPVSIETIVVPDPGPGEAVVKIQACGVCLTDLHYREGGINDDFPFLLGQPGVTVSFDDRRLVVDFPPDLPTHSPRQAFHLDVHGQLLRHDYTAEVYGRWAHVANLVRGSTVTGGHRFYTRRRAWARLGSGSAIVPWPLIIWIELDDLVVAREEGATP